jgi:hypothetical protein
LARGDDDGIGGGLTVVDDLVGEPVGTDCKYLLDVVGLGDTGGCSTAADCTSASGRMLSLFDLDLLVDSDELVTVFQSCNRSLTDLLFFGIRRGAVIVVMGGGGTALVAMAMASSVSFSGSGLTIGVVGEGTPGVRLVLVWKGLLVLELLATTPLFFLMVPGLVLGVLVLVRARDDDADGCADVTLSHAFKRAATPNPTGVLVVVEASTGEFRFGNRLGATGCFETIATVSS